MESISECLIRYIDVTTPILILNITDTVVVVYTDTPEHTQVYTATCVPRTTFYNFMQK